VKIKNIIVPILCALMVIVGLLFGNSCQSRQDFVLLNTVWSEEIPLKGGLSGAAIDKVSDGKKTYVVRYFRDKGPVYITREIQAQKIASDGGYGPHVYAYDDKKIIMSFLEGSKETIDLATKAFKMAELLKKIHNGPAFGERESLVHQGNRLLARVTRYPKGVDKDTIISIVNKLVAFPIVNKLPIHGDLNPNNILLVNGEYKVIDFENAGQDDPLFDVATILIYNFANTPYESEFLRYYFGHTPSQEEIARLNVMKQAVLLDAGLTLLSRIQPDIIDQAGDPVAFDELLNAYNQGKLSIEDPHNVVKVAQSMLKMVIDLEQY
jgi:thiamine kinase-like enzyme